MSPIFVIQSLSATGAFANRAFLPAFLTAMLFRFAPEISWISTFLQLELHSMPSWFTHDITLVILGIGCIIELFFLSQETLLEFTEETRRWLPPSLSLLTYFGVLSSTEQDFIHQAIPLFTSGVGDFILPVFLFALTLWSANKLLLLERFCFHLDPDNSLGVQTIFSWCRNSSAILLLVLAIVLPLLAFFFTLVLFICLALLQRFLRQLEKRKQKSCQSCGETIFSAAPCCPSCKAPQNEVIGINWLGFSSTKPATSNHQFRLLAANRCPSCADFLPNNSTYCPQCNTSFLQTEEDQQNYLSQVQKRLPTALFIAFICSFIPVAGFAISYLTNSLTLVRPLQNYTHWKQKIFSKFLLKIVRFLSLLLHWIPLFGQLFLLLQTWLSWQVHHSNFAKKHL